MHVKNEYINYSICISQNDHSCSLHFVLQSLGRQLSRIPETHPREAASQRKWRRARRVPHEIPHGWKNNQGQDHGRPGHQEPLLSHTLFDPRRCILVHVLAIAAAVRMVLAIFSKKCSHDKWPFLFFMIRRNRWFSAEAAAAWQQNEFDFRVDSLESMASRFHKNIENKIHLGWWWWTLLCIYQRGITGLCSWHLRW